MSNAYSPSGNKIWKHPSIALSSENLVVIHVYDESQVSNVKDFISTKQLLRKNMGYFKNLLTENDDVEEDIDIAVHCDVFIFEWLMLWIHQPNEPPQLDCRTVVSILISSEFLQMEPLVTLCIEYIAVNLNDIIKMPLDLSCINEKFINRIAALTDPQTLSTTKDKKDKIVNKLYKRRVEIDFSRRSVKNGCRTIASSLTCCRKCASLYLETCSGSLVCSVAGDAPSVDFRGKLNRRHVSSPNWSLTSYLKTLHGGGIPWSTLYWHVWGACQFLQIDRYVFSALESEKYTLVDDGVLLLPRAVALPHNHTHSRLGGWSIMVNSLPSFDLLQDDQCATPGDSTLKLVATRYDSAHASQDFTPTLDPSRPINILPVEVHSLLLSQHTLIAGSQHTALIDRTLRASLTHDNGNIGDMDTAGSSQSNVLEYFQGEEAFALHSEEIVRGRSSSPLGRRSLNNKDSLSQPRKSPTALIADGNRALVGAQKTSSLTRPAVHPSSRTLAETSSVDSASIMSSMPHEVISFINHQRNKDSGCLHLKGFPVGSSPLSVLPIAMQDVLIVVQQSDLSDAEKFEWMKDVMREYDDKRIGRFESFLLNKRVPVSRSPQRISSVVRANQSSGATFTREKGQKRLPCVENRVAASQEYYRDRARQPVKTI